jgi:hypothetical protein
MDTEKEELLQIIDRLNNQVNQLNLENIILKSKLDILNKKQQENQED